jgi:hypothetical protein
MATRKLKKVSDTIEPANVPSGGWPKIQQGSHLTVKTFEDGRTELVWDDEALTRDVHNAILSVESRLPVTETKPKRKKKEKDNV